MITPEYWKTENVMTGNIETEAVSTYSMSTQGKKKELGTIKQCAGIFSSFSTDYCYSAPANNLRMCV